LSKDSGEGEERQWGTEWGWGVTKQATKNFEESPNSIIEFIKVEGSSSKHTPEPKHAKHKSGKKTPKTGSNCPPLL